MRQPVNRLEGVGKRNSQVVFSQASISRGFLPQPIVSKPILSKPILSRATHPRLAGFSWIDLLVVILILAALIGLLLPPLLGSSKLGQRTACLNHLRQLQVAYILYAGDHQDQLVPNEYLYDARNTNAPLQTGASWCPGNVRQDVDTSNIVKGGLFPYHQSVAIYRCPSDPGRVPLPDGGWVSRTRSYNLSIWLNTKPQVLGSYTHLAEIRDPNPSSMFSFIDVHEDAIEDPTFGLYPLESRLGKTWLDLPADRHQQGANLAFVDGHAEHWRWKARKIFIQFVQQPRRMDGDLDDFRRLQSAIPSWQTIRERGGR